MAANQAWAISCWTIIMQNTKHGDVLYSAVHDVMCTVYDKDHMSALQ